jgi:cell wall assembly regulator SMI1
VTPTVPDRATTKRVNAAWKRLEVWLAAHAPASYRSLRPPAAAKEVAAAQRRMSVAFPADLVASLLRHDGVTNPGTAFTLPFFFEPMPVREIAPEWLSLCTAVADVFGEENSDWWDGAFVPFASSGDGGNLLVDQRPGNHSRVGEFFNEEGVSFEEHPGSVAELLEKTALSLESGRPYDNQYRPEVTKAGVLDWDVI